MTNDRCPPPPVGAEIGGDPCAALAELRHAYFTMLTGNKRHQVQYRDRNVVYHAGNLHLLQAEIRRLERICPRSATNPHGGQRGAMRAGPYVPAGSTPRSAAFFSRNPYRW